MDVQQEVLLKGYKVYDERSLKVEVQITKNKEIPQDVRNSRGASDFLRSGISLFSRCLSRGNPSLVRNPDRVMQIIVRYSSPYI
jgi:hypothetical protein